MNDPTQLIFLEKQVERNNEFLCIAVTQDIYILSTDNIHECVIFRRNIVKPFGLLSISVI